MKRTKLRRGRAGKRQQQLQCAQLGNAGAVDEAAAAVDLSDPAFDPAGIVSGGEVAAPAEEEAAEATASATADADLAVETAAADAAR